MGKVKFRVVEFEVEGTDASIVESLRSIQAALTKQSSVPRNSLPNRSAAALPSLSEPEDEEGDGSADSDDSTIDSEANEVGTSASTAARAPRKNRKPPEVKLIDLDFKSSVSLEKYSSERRVDSDQKKYVTIIAWFADCRSSPAVTRDHVYTAYRAMKWTCPKDMQKPLTNLCGGHFLKREESGVFSVTHIGRQLVEIAGDV